MPLYEYRCLTCNEVFTLVRKFSDPALESCIYCPDGRVEKLISLPSPPKFTGTGFYETDYKKKKED